MSERPATLAFLGAAGTVTGSRFLVETDRARVLVDCGLFQGLRDLRRRNWAPFPTEPATIDAVALTHAHVDHSGFLPGLVRHGFKGTIVATVGTTSLSSIVLPDAGRLQEEDAEYANRKGFSKHAPALPLYTEEDAGHALDRFRPVPFGTEVPLAPGITAEFRRAGHILGAASIVLTVEADRTSRIFFSGDVGRPTHPILLPPQPPPDVDVVVVESTYGDRSHEGEEKALNQLADAVARTAERGGVVVIPAFAVDRTEVLLLALARLIEKGRIPRLPVYADSPMALAVLDAYREAISRGDPDIRADLAAGDPFDAAGELHQMRTTAESRSLNDVAEPSIIISASGMATGGRVIHHLARRLPDRRNAVVLCGFQAEGTRGRQLADGARNVRMFGGYVPVRADVIQIDAFSAHADADELVDWLRPVSPPVAAYVVHGEQTASEALRDRLDDELAWTAVVPYMGERMLVRPAHR
jgi:metallo-beta-lactamase family protein